MEFQVSLIQMIIVGSVINGFIFVFLVLEKKENRQANRFLSLTIISMCLTFTPFILDIRIWNSYQWLSWLPFSLSYWIGPAFYFYIKILTEGSKVFRKKDFWHFSPLVLNYLHSIYHAFTGSENPWPFMHHFAELLESAAILSVMIYLVFSFRLVKSYQRSLLNNVSNTELIDLRWVNKFIVITAASFILILIFVIAGMLVGGKFAPLQWTEPRAFILLIYSVVLYWLSISGFKQAQTHQVLDIKDEPNEQSDDQLSEVIQKLSSIIESDKLHRNPELSLSNLSEASGISERVISNAINNELGKNFFQFINDYRIEEVKDLLMDPANDHLKIISLAYGAGFNSKASFNRVFKSSTGLTPIAFRASKR